jgi:hypothetical protein
MKELLVTNPETTILQYEGKGKPGTGYWRNSKKLWVSLKYWKKEL